MLIDNVWYSISEDGEIIGVNEKMTEWHRNWSLWDEIKWKIKKVRRTIVRCLVRPTFRYPGHFWTRLLTRLHIVHGGAVVMLTESDWPYVWSHGECIKCDMWYDFLYDEDLLPFHAPLVGDEFTVASFQCGSDDKSLWHWDGDVHLYDREYPDEQ